MGSRWKSANVDPRERFEESDHLKTRLSRPEDQEGGAILDKANFRQSDLSGTAFSRRHETATESKQNTSSWGNPKEQKLWTKQFFRSAAVTDCDFSEAALLRCGCEGLSLAGSKFDSTNLQQANMQFCHVAGIDLSTANLLDANLTKCRYTEGTVFPCGFAVPKGATLNGQASLRSPKEVADVFSDNIGVVIFLTIAVFLFLFAIWGK